MARSWWAPYRDFSIRRASAAFRTLELSRTVAAQVWARRYLLKALDGFAAVGAKRAFLEVTARNEPAVRMYRRLGFRSYKTIYREVRIPDAETAPLAADPVGVGL